MTRSPSGTRPGPASRPSPTRSGSRSPSRARAAVFALGTLLFTAALILHPLVLDPAAESLAYRTIATYRLWSAIHWGAIAGIALWTLPLTSDPGTAPAARQALTTGLALWIVVLSFEAVALPQLAQAAVPGLWAWTLAVGYLGAVLDGTGLALLGWPGAEGARLLPVLGTVIAATSILAYALPATAIPAVAAAGLAALLATAIAVHRWW